jgi:hypothetical protein
MKEVICQHCSGYTTGKVYRVTNEEGALVILDMVVCEACSREAQKLGLKTQELNPNQVYDRQSKTH